MQWYNELEILRTVIKAQRIKDVPIPSKRSTMKQKRSDQLREAIEEKSPSVAPGKRLDEAVLLAEFGVSRTPLREALIQLASLGLIELRPRRGAVVAEVSPKQLIEMFEVMGELEAMCGRLAARRITEDEQQRLLAAHNACKAAAESDGPDAYYYANERFHFAIYNAAHNSFLAMQARQLHRKLRVYRRLQLRVRNRMASSFAEHEGVVAAILAGNGDVAAERIPSTSSSRASDSATSSPRSVLAA
jgi:DNA-binding GntR family transcriptional regulator